MIETIRIFVTLVGKTLQNLINIIKSYTLIIVTRFFPTSIRQTDSRHILKDSVILLRNKTHTDHYQEFHSVEKISPFRTIREALREKNSGKNRYSDILPYDETRVILLSRNNENNQPTGDYINANYCSIVIDPSCIGGNNNSTGNADLCSTADSASIKTTSSTTMINSTQFGTPNFQIQRKVSKIQENFNPKTSRRKNLHYIATQGPKKNTIGDFWSMVLQQNIKIIIMLTQLYDGTKEKCAAYWPQSLKESRSWPSSTGRSDITVELISDQPFYGTNKSEEKRIIFYIRKIQIIYYDPNDGGKKKKEIITQVQYLAWPDHGVPDEQDDFLDLVNYIAKIRDETDEKYNRELPVCVHCSAGSGRTGVFISVETAINQIMQSLPLKPKQVLQQMRLQRAQMIQKPEQYAFSNYASLKWYERNGHLYT